MKEDAYWDVHSKSYAVKIRPEYSVLETMMEKRRKNENRKGKKEKVDTK